MKQLLTILPALLLLSACKKSDKPLPCLDGQPTIRQIINKPAVVTLSGPLNTVYLVEEGSIDTKLSPCNLSQEFQQNALPVIISGEVKAAVRNTMEPCCIESFVITSIRRR